MQNTATINSFDEFDNVEPPADFVPLSTYGLVTRGIASGHNGFFTINQEKIQSLGLKKNDYFPCITKSNQLKTDILNEKSFNALAKANQPVFLFCPRNTINQMSDGARAYIERGEKARVHERSTTLSRKIWYQCEQGKPPAIFFGVLYEHKPKVVLNTSNAMALTCFHGFEPNDLGEMYLEGLFGFLKSNMCHALLHNQKRRCGSNLSKLELSDLNTLKVPPPDKLKDYLA